MVLQRVSSVIIGLYLVGSSVAAENTAELAPVRIALVGDSTVASYPDPPADRPSLTGWGQVFDEFFSDRVAVLNHAVSGHSSKSFIRAGLWQKTLEAKPAYVFIQFGHNDQPGKGDRSTDVNSDYQEYLRQYVQDARALGAIPVLVTSVARRTFQDGKPHTTLQPYVAAMKQVGQTLHVPVIDLHAASVALFAELGDAGSADLSPAAADRSHFSRKGARTMAKLVAEALPQAVPELQPYLVDAWFGNRVGITDTVPAPWTPLVIEGAAVKPWGRTYHFDRSLLPTEVVTREAAVLAAPIALRGRAAGKPLAFSGAPIQFATRTPTVVSLTGCATADGLTVTGKTTVEYDGMVRVDLAVTPQGDHVTVDELLLDMPLRPEYARYLYHFPGQWGSVANSGFLPAAGWAQAFKPFVWLGDEDRGLAWFCESDENWTPADPKRALTISRSADRVVFCCHLIERPTLLTGPLQYTFGFQATPVKNPEKTVWDYRLTHSGNYGLEREPAQGPGTEITYPAAGRVRAEAGTFECWYRPAYDTERELPVEQRQHMANRSLFTIQWGPEIQGGTNCGFYWNELVQGPVVWSRKDGKVLLNPGAPFDWKGGEWHHLALTWSDKICIYVDGKLLSESPNAGFIPAPVDKAVIEIGGGSALATIDEVRILSVARPPAAHPGPCEPDAQTLLLDHFDNYRAAAAGDPSGPDAPSRRDGLESHPATIPEGKADPSLTFVPAKFGLGPTWEPAYAPTQLQRLASRGVRTICFHEHWSPYQSHPYVTAENRPRLKSLVDACHQQGIGLLLYMARQFADNTPEWRRYSKEVLAEPAWGIYQRQPPQKAYYVCWNSVWKDFCLFHLDRLLAEFGHDGWYLDGPEWPLACNNPRHGCGYRAADGTLRPTYDIFATREFMQRLYVLTRQRKPDGQLNIHNSTVMVIPTLGWGTSTWGGEQIDAIKPPVKTLDILPMDAFRTEFMGRQWGVPSEFLVYDGQPYYARDVLAYTLLHGVLIRPAGYEALDRIATLWKVYDEFPFQDAKLYPYWNNANLLKCEPAGVYATAYERPGEGLLMFVSNLTDRDADATVTLHLDHLNWRGISQVWDAVSREVIVSDNGTLRWQLSPWAYRVVRVKPEAND